MHITTTLIDFRECAMGQALGCRLAIVEARVWAHARQCGIYGGQSDTELGVPPSSPAFPGHDYSYHQSSILIYWCHPNYIILPTDRVINPLNPELNPICYLLALLGTHHFLHVSRIRVKSLTLRRLMSYIHGAPILDVSRSHTTTQHSR